MKIQNKLTISYHAECADLPDGDTGYDEALHVLAMVRINKMIEDGYREGELIETVRLGRYGEPEDGHEFKGWWKTYEMQTDEEELMQRAIVKASDITLTAALPHGSMDESEALGFISDHVSEDMEGECSEAIWERIKTIAQAMVEFSK